jgi:hypothetical protein
MEVNEMRKECDFCDDGCQQATEDRCVKEAAANQKPHHRHPVDGEEEKRT